MTIQQAIAFLEASGYTIKPSAPGSYIVTDAGGESRTFLEADVIAGAMSLAQPVGEAPPFEQGQGPLAPGQERTEPATPVPDKPVGWPSYVPWPPLRWVISGTDREGKPVYKQEFDFAAYNSFVQESRLAGTEARLGEGTERFPLPEGQPRTFDEGGQTFAWDSTIGDYKRVADAPPLASPIEQFLDTVTEGGWSIDQYGYQDANGQTIITKRQPRQPIKEPIANLDDMIAEALKGANLRDPQDANTLRAQSLFDFKNQITNRQLNFEMAQARLQTALQIAQSPSDYLTLVALYTGAITRDNPAKVGERLAPLAPILQQMAQQFFLDIPGFNTVPPFQAPSTGVGETTSGAGVTTTGAAGIGGVRDGNTPPPGWGTSKFVPNDTWSSWTPEQREHFMDTGEWPVEAGGAGAFARQGPAVPPPAGEPAIPIGQIGPTQVPGGPPQVPTGPEPGLLGGNGAVPGLLGGQAAINGTSGEPAIPGLLGGKPKVAMQSLQPDQGAPTGDGASTGGQDSTLLMLGNVGKFLQQLGKQNKLPIKQPIPQFAHGGTVPGPLGQPQLAQVEGGETVLTPEQIQALLQQSGMFGKVFRPPLQELPSFLNRPRTTTLSELTGGLLRPRSLQTIRGQSPTARMLTLETAKSFGIPGEDFLEEERAATSIGGPGRRLAQLRPGLQRIRA